MQIIDDPDLETLAEAIYDAEQIVWSEPGIYEEQDEGTKKIYFRMAQIVLASLSDRRCP